ncbi:MAG: hypothetical protein LBC47_06110 [Tannerella sp.]|jgi:hypothetical protein|nr:hypothetical protein [Tannerella sp.]
MTDKYKHIEELLERFFEGYTSNTEEQELYGFFAGSGVPEHLLRYKPLFACFDAGLEAKFCEKEPPVRKRRYRRHRILWPGIAAAALLALVLMNPFGYGDKPFDPYEGSYIVRNGVRITDPEIIRPELEATVRRILQQQEEAERLATKMMNADNRFPAMEEYIQAHRDAILEHVQDENIREEVRKMLEEE